ncbi:MAG: hypothetical protein E7212_02340 [Clostridium sartagoforme]|nr:hypothetical protein [Clostridium sartagoforme]
MSNLGGYQVITTLAKKVGGPKNLAILTAASGYLFIRGVEAGTKICVKKVKKYLKNNESEYNYTKVIYEVTLDGKDKDGLEFNVGDKYRVIESDGEAILIEKIGDSNNPYCVSIDFLERISNFVR